MALRIERQNNAVKRSFMMFASYDKEASYDGETDTYTIQLYYYDFDRCEILQQILSLGAAATVLAPADMREAIRSHHRAPAGRLAEPAVDGALQILEEFFSCVANYSTLQLLRYLGS